MPEWLTWGYDEWCEEAGVSVLYEASLVGVTTEGDALTACVVQTVLCRGFIAGGQLKAGETECIRKNWRKDCSAAC